MGWIESPSDSEVEELPPYCQNFMAMPNVQKLSLPPTSFSFLVSTIFGEMLVVMRGDPEKRQDE